MIPPTEPHYLLPGSVPTVLVYLLAVAAVVAWVLAHVLWRPRGGAWRRAAAWAARVGVGFLAMLAVSQAMQRGLVFKTNWAIWPIALVGALAVEIVLGLYALERRTISRPAGLGLAALRIAVTALVVAMFAQPVRPWDLEKTVERWVAVLVDTSASMFVPDTQLAPSERMRLAETLGIDGAARPYRVEQTAEEMDKVRQDLAAQGEWLASLAASKVEARQRQLEGRRKDMNEAFTKADQKLAAFVAQVGRPVSSPLKLDDRVRQGLDEVARKLTSPMRDHLKEMIALTSSANAAGLGREHERLLQVSRQAATDLGGLVAQTAAMAQGVDEAVYASLAPDVRTRIDQVAARKRMTLARDVLLHRPPATPQEGEKTDTAAKPAANLLEELQSRYGVKMYTFASDPAEVDLKAYSAAYKGSEDTPETAASLPPAQQQTDFTRVFEKVMAEMSDRQLSGVLLLTDGRHNAPKSVEPLVRQLGVRQVPVSSVVFGAEKPPLDAGIIGVEAPETVALQDKMFITAQLKLDGLAGKEVRVSLTDGEKVIETQTVRVPTDTYRARVQFADEPKSAGMHRYAVDVQKFDGEVLTTNNQYPLAVSVSDERTRLLLIDGRPRWEFRYIKNLFTSRDRTVRLQYVLLEPDAIEGVPTPPKIEASASRPLDEVEANALPKDEAEWMKFDVIILGDVPAKALDESRQKILRRFVNDRGGTLIVIAGPLHCPHEYTDLELVEMLPVAIRKGDALPDQSPDEKFYIALTAEGRESIIMRQQVNPDENRAIWEGVPEIYWRHPMLQAKEGATVLAYALPAGAPAFLPQRGGAATTGDEPLGEDLVRQRRDFERSHALITHHNVALGKVMFLSFDHTWRLRYLVGDTYHHRFWGQVLRWATANKLPAGTETVKLGTDRTRYAPQASVRVQAKLARKDYTPIVSNDVAVKVFAGAQMKLRKPLQYVANSAGMYEADLGELPSGAYRVELDAPPAIPILAEDKVDSVSVEFSVDPATPAEQAELSPDRGLLGRLATLTGGTVADPARAQRVLGSLGPVTEVQIERHEYVLWDSWPLLAVILALATAEWLLRKKVGLA